MTAARADQLQREASHLHHLQRWLARAGLYAAANRMNEARKAHQQRWAAEAQGFKR